MSLKSKYAVLERFNVETLYNTFLGLQPREQIMAMVVTGIVLILVIIMPISLANSRISKLEKDISTSREQINDVAREIGDYNSEKSRLNAVESQLRSGFDTSISTTIESLASQSGIKENVESLKEKPLAPSDIFDEASVDVKIARITLEQLVDFLYKVEGEKGRVLRVKQLQTKPRYDNRKLLDASFQVSTFKLSGEGG
jgi:general secretion pathway protein M